MVKMTPRQKTRELIEQVGVFNAIYVVDSILIVIKEYPNNNEDVEDWLKVKDELEKRLKKL